MKKLVLFAFIFGFTFAARAQEMSENTIGLRLGANDGFGGEISYQRRLFDENRAEVNFGWANNSYADAVRLTGLYQWVWEIQDRLNWYAGAGGGIGSWSFTSEYKTNNPNYSKASGTYVILAGNIGIEYGFEDFPVLVSLDFRPEIILNNGYGKNYGSSFGLGLRYQF